MSAHKRLGRLMVYGLCLTPAIIMLGFYWLEYIPSQLEYFMNLRFRTLSIISDQLRTKIESLATSLENAPKLESDAAKYIQALVPDLKYQGCSGSAVAPAVEFGTADDAVRFRSTKGCEADASMSQIFSRFIRDDLFDDVVLAEGSGRVVYQLSTSSPRIANLGELIKTVSDVKTPSKEASGFDADAVRSIHLDGSEFLLLLQPVHISMSGPRLMAGGLVRSGRLAVEAHHVPPMYLLVVCAPLLIIVLSGPFLKILLLTRTGRLTFHDMALLSLFTLVAACLISVLLASWHHYVLSAPKTEPDLAQFANSVNEQIGTDVERMRRTIDQFDAALPAISNKIDDRTDLLASNLPAEFAKDPILFDFVFWTNADGCQVTKWTTKRFNTQRINQRPEPYFQNVVAKRFWSVREKPFTVQTLISPTTSQPIVVIAIPSRHAGISAPGCGQAESSPIVSAAIVASLNSLSTPLVPSEAGFAIFEPSGRVLFHSSPERNLHENLFEEIHSAAQLRARVTMRAEQSVSTYYRGRKYEFYTRPVTGLGAIPWNIAVFRELEPQQAMIGRVWAETLILFLALWCVIIAGLGVLSLILSAGPGWRWRRQVDFLLTKVWPDPAREPVFRRLSWELAAMTLVSLTVVAVGSDRGYRSAGWLLIFYFLLSLAAIALVAFRFRNPMPTSWDILPSGKKQPAYVVCLSLLTVLLAVVPTMGLFGICRAYESRLNLMHWQQQLLNSVDALRSRVKAEVEGSPALSEKAKQFIREHFLKEGEAPGARDPLFYVSNFWQTKMENSAGSAPPIPRTWWQGLLSSIRPETEEKAMETGALALDYANAYPCRWHLGGAGERTLILKCGDGPGAPVTIQSSLPAITIPSDGLWWGIVLMLLGGIYGWNSLASTRLFNLEFDYSPLPLLTEVPRATTPRSHLMVLGLPLARKDKAVRQWLGYTPPRVNLYSEQFSYNWLDLTLARLRQELMPKTAAVAAQAAGAGGATQLLRTAPVKPWVHISNLEAKLGDARERHVVADLLERLLVMDLDGSCLRLILTSAVDPVFHFDSVLSDERKKIYEHPLPEPELQRLARLLHNFRKVQVPNNQDLRPDWADSAMGQIVYAECSHHPALLDVGEEVAQAAPPDVRRKTVLAMVAERAQALYKLFWASCTRSEKLLLIQLAQTGLVNPLCLDTLADLVRKGLVLPGPRPRIMNETFQRFLETVEGADTVRLWESEAGESSWLIIRNVVLALIAISVIVLAVTQYQALQTLVTVITGVGTVLAGLLRVFGFFGRRGGSSTESLTQAV